MTYVVPADPSSYGGKPSYTISKAYQIKIGDIVTDTYIRNRLTLITKMINQLTTVNITLLNTANFIGEWAAGGDPIEPLDTCTEQFNFSDTLRDTCASYSGYLYEFIKDVDELLNR